MTSGERRRAELIEQSSSPVTRMSMQTHDAEVRAAERLRRNTEGEPDWTASFTPVVYATDHRWRINDGEPTHGHGVICDRCKLELVPCVDMVGMSPHAALYVAGSVGEKYTPSTHGKCPCPGESR